MHAENIFSLAEKQPTAPGLIHVIQAFPFAPLTPAQFKLVKSKSDRLFLAFEDDSDPSGKSFGPAGFKTKLIRRAVSRADVLCVWS